jgi:hypothetical protein
MALPDRWIFQGERSEQLAEAGLDVPGIVRTVRGVVDSSTSFRVAGEPLTAAARG